MSDALAHSPLPTRRSVDSPGRSGKALVVVLMDVVPADVVQVGLAEIELAADDPRADGAGDREIAE